MIEGPRRPGLYRMTPHVQVVGDKAAATFVFRGEDTLVHESVVIFIDLSTGDATVQPIEGTRLARPGSFDGRRIVAEGTPWVAVVPGSRTPVPIAAPDKLQSLLRRGSAFRCGGMIWTSDWHIGDPSGFEERVLQRRDEPATPEILWRVQTRTPAQMAWQPWLSSPGDAVRCLHNRVITTSALVDRWEPGRLPALVVTVSEPLGEPGVGSVPKLARHFEPLLARAKEATTPETHVPQTVRRW